jgi:hypothetical protein
MFHHVRIAGRVLLGNLSKIYSQDLPSFLVCQQALLIQRFPFMFILVLERPGSSSLEYPLSSLLELQSLSLNPLSSSRLDGLLLCDLTALDSTTLPGWGRIRVASLWLGIVSAVADAVIPSDEGRDGECRLKPDKRNKFCCSGLMVKSSICPTWPMLSMSRASWLKETPCPSQPSRITAVKEQQCRECGRNVNSVSVGRMSSDDPPRLW